MNGQNTVLVVVVIALGPAVHFGVISSLWTKKSAKKAVKTSTNKGAK
jgi:hypothetical protein